MIVKTAWKLWGMPSRLPLKLIFCLELAIVYQTPRAFCDEYSTETLTTAH